MKKLLTTSVIAITLLLGSTVSAENNTATSLTDIAPAVKPVINSLRAQPMRAELERKTDLREEYQNKLEELKDKYQEERNTATKATKELREEHRSTLEAFKERYKEQVSVAKEERKGQLEEEKRERIKGYTEKVISNFNKTLDRIDQITEKIEARITFMEEKGFDVTEPNLLIIDVPVKTNLARETINAINDSLENILDSTDPKQSFDEVKELINSAKTNVKEAHASLVEVIKSIKASVKVENDSEEASNNESETNEDEANDNNESE